jgi:hypothetical protein
MISIYRNQSRVMRISDQTLLALTPGLEALRLATGRTLDPYTTTTLEAAHARILLSAIGSTQSMSAEACELLGVIRLAASDGVTLLFEGE